VVYNSNENNLFMSTKKTPLKTTLLPFSPQDQCSENNQKSIMNKNVSLRGSVGFHASTFAPPPKLQSAVAPRNH
jgi:hypothetical protein